MCRHDDDDEGVVGDGAVTPLKTICAGTSVRRLVLRQGTMHAIMVCLLSPPAVLSITYRLVYLFMVLCISVESAENGCLIDDCRTRWISNDSTYIRTVVEAERIHALHGSVRIYVCPVHAARQSQRSMPRIGALQYVITWPTNMQGRLPK